MIDDILISNYAKLLFNESSSQGKSAQILEELTYLNELFYRAKKTRVNLEKLIITKPGDTGLSMLMYRFLNLLRKNRRFNDFSFIMNYYKKLYYLNLGITLVMVRTSEKLSEESLVVLKNMLQSNYSLDKLNIESTLDTSLVYGIVLEFNNLVVEATYNSLVTYMRAKIVRGVLDEIK